MPRKRPQDLGDDLVATKSKRATKAKAPRQASVLTESQEKYVEARATGLTVKDSMVAAGMKPNDGTGNALEKHPKVLDALNYERRKNAYMLGITRETVLEGMMEAIGQAKVLSDPMSQIAGWREIAKICGFYAPEVKKIELTGSAKRVVEQMQQLSDAELLEIAQGDVIEAEYAEVRH